MSRGLGDVYKRQPLHRLLKEIFQFYIRKECILPVLFLKLLQCLSLELNFLPSLLLNFYTSFITSHFIYETLLLCFTTRFRYKNNHKVYFCPRNEAFLTLFQPENDTMYPIFCLDVKVIGKVIGLFREI